MLLLISRKTSLHRISSRLPNLSNHRPGYFIYHGSNLAGMNTTFAQLWKEYALSDSRYLTSDVFVASIETITVV